jgi:hypothetical protein
MLSIFLPSLSLARLDFRGRRFRFSATGDVGKVESRTEMLGGPAVTIRARLFLCLGVVGIGSGLCDTLVTEQPTQKSK